MKQKISAVILTKNEQNNISRALKSINFCSEIIVIDDYSTDKTIQIAQKNGVKIYRRKLNNNYAAQRNFALQKAKSPWVLFVDADEQVTPELAKSILKATGNNSYNGYYLCRKDMFMGKLLNHGEWGSQWLLRLGKRDSGVWTRSVHEYWDIKTKKQILNGYLFHYPHTTLSQFVNSIKDRSGIHATELSKENKDNLVALKLLLYPIAKFLQNMFLRKGILDGTHGFVFAILLSFQSFISWSHLWLKNHKQLLNS